MNSLLQARRAYPLLVLDFAKAIGQIPSWLALSDRPATKVEIPGDYIGINIATAQDPAVDDYLLARLAELDIKQVRMDYSYDSPAGPAQRLLDRLLHENFDVMLEIFPPREEAARLFKDGSSQSRWRDFVSCVFEQYGGRVTWFEIGSTPNRGKWSGFSFLSYQAAWSIAIEQASAFDITLAGANVSDFEPFYNAAFLSYMHRLGRAPDIHSDNLFVERVVEPEAYDHRVLGHIATGRLKLNLVKKARILTQIGQQYGSPQTVCTYKCWTAKRLARHSASPAQKKVDYLVRYLVLAAASGALRRVYWGPLICSRDGLIDDHSMGYPVIDQVSYYQRVRGDLADFQPTRAFAALANAAARLRGSRVSCIAHQSDGISLFRLEHADSPEQIVCWCRDGLVWPLRNLFSADDLTQARFVDATGSTVPQPVVVNEHPVFIEFATAGIEPALRDLENLSAQGLIHLSSDQFQSIADVEGPWRGASMLRAAQQQHDTETVHLLRPSVLPTLPETAVLRDARNRIWNIADPRGFKGEISVKLNRVSGIKAFTYRFRPSKGRRHWNNACEMLRRGVATPAPVAFYERDKRPGIEDSWYLCEFLPEAFSVKDVYAAIRKGAVQYRGLDQQAWLCLIAEFVCDMHNSQILHRDLSAGNILLRQQDNGTVEPYLIDIGRTWLGRGSGLKPRQRLQDLMRIGYKLDWPAREYFVARYEERMGKPLPRWWPIPFHYYDYKQKLKKSIKSKSKQRRG